MYAELSNSQVHILITKYGSGILLDIFSEYYIFNFLTSLNDIVFQRIINSSTQKTKIYLLKLFCSRSRPQLSKIDPVEVILKSMEVYDLNEIEVNYLTPHRAQLLHESKHKIEKKFPLGYYTYSETIDYLILIGCKINGNKMLKYCQTVEQLYHFYNNFENLEDPISTYIGNYQFHLLDYALSLGFKLPDKINITIQDDNSIKMVNKLYELGATNFDYKFNYRAKMKNDDIIMLFRNGFVPSLKDMVIFVDNKKRVPVIIEALKGEFSKNKNNVASLIHEIEHHHNMKTSKKRQMLDIVRQYT